MSNMSHIQTDLKYEDSVIDALENEFYLKPDFGDNFKNEVKQKIEEFSNWFNSIARLYFLRCKSPESEVFVYLLLNLKKKLKYAISEINKSVNNEDQSFSCNICEEIIEVQPWENVWSILQNHPHFEQSYIQAISSNHSENGESSVSEDSSEDLNLVTEQSAKSQENGLNNFKFNFVITYDKKVEETLYPESLMLAARKRDNIQDYHTIQKCGTNRAMCLLCPCKLTARGRVQKITSFAVKNHTSGQQHLKSASAVVNISALKQYHEFWRSQAPDFQAHQVHFIPESVLSIIKCYLCQEYIQYTSVIDHIQGKTHKSKVLKIFQSPGASSDFYLLNMQLGVYGQEVVNNAKVEANKAKEGDPGN